MIYVMWKTEIESQNLAIKKLIYCMTQNIMEFAKFWMNKSKVGQYT